MPFTLISLPATPSSKLYPNARYSAPKVRANALNHNPHFLTLHPRTHHPLGALFMPQLHPCALAAPFFFGLATLAFTAALSGTNPAHADTACSVGVDSARLVFSHEPGSDGLMAQELALISGRFMRSYNTWEFSLGSSQGNLTYHLRPREVEEVSTSEFHTAALTQAGGNQ